MAAIYEHQRDFAKAVEAAKTGVEVLTDSFGLDHVETIQGKLLLERLEKASEQQRVS
jgi:hypothetical protein